MPSQKPLVLSGMNFSRHKKKKGENLILTFLNQSQI